MIKTIFQMKEPVFSHSFFEDEVREGFFVPNMMKRFWAAQVKVLKVFSDVCTRIGVRWFAGEGTLLGAARHEGYIPWDDDIDIYVMRRDFPRLITALKEELPDWPALTVRDDEAILSGTLRFVNGKAVRYYYEYLKDWYGCPYTVGIDVFALDNVFDDPEEEAERLRKAQTIREACDMIRKGKDNTPGFRGLLQRIERENGVQLKHKDNLPMQLLCLKEDLYESCESDTTEQVAVYWEIWSPRYMKREWFTEWTELPFESTTVPVPVAVDEVLRHHYGDWHKIYRFGGGHTYPCYTMQQDVMEESSNSHLFSYTYQESDFKKEREKTKRAYALQVANTLSALYTQADTLRAAGNEAGAVVLEAGGAKLEASLVSLTQNTGGRDYLDGHREIVFLACRPEWWKTMENAYRKARRAGDAEVFLLPVPWYEKELDGSTGVMHNEKEHFPDDVRKLFSEEYDFTTRCPDIIVTQVPFDGWNYSIMTPSAYFAENLRNFTDRLIYIPCYDVPTPEAADEKSIISLQSLIEQPAVMFADEVWLADEGMRTLYIEWLCKIGGEGVRSLAESRFVVESKATF